MPDGGRTCLRSTPRRTSSTVVGTTVTGASGVITMAKRGRRSAEELKNVPTSDMTPDEYDRSNTPGTYQVRTKGARYTVTGLHSANAVQRKVGGEIKKIGD